jgi:hypothetical protein
MAPHDAPPALLIDREAERGLLACMAENVSPPAIDPAHITCDYIRVLYLTAKALQDAGLLLFPRDFGDAGECARLRAANCELIAHNIDAAGCWPDGVDSPRWVLKQCMELASLPWLVDWYARRIRTAALRRQMLERAQELHRLALSPVPLDEVAA